MFRRVWIAMLLAADLVFGIIRITPTPAIAQKQGGSKTPETVIKLLDADGDGQVSRGEWRKPMKLFNTIDADADDKLTYEELQAHLIGGPLPESAAIEWIDVHAHPITGRNERSDVKGAIDAAVAAHPSALVPLSYLAHQPLYFSAR